MKKKASLLPIFDFNIVENENIFRSELDKQQQNKGIENSKVIENQDHRSNNNKQPSQQQQQQDSRRFKIKRGLKIKLDCEFCKGPISASPHVYKFATYERFFVVQDACLITSKNMLEE
jgi:hypothetical protein